jgi:hypothetical protein
MNGSIPTLLMASISLVVPPPLHGQTVESTVTFLKRHGDPIWVKRFLPSGASCSPMAVLMVPGWPAVSIDVLGLQADLSSTGIHVFMVHPRWHGESSGEASLANAHEDVGTVWDWNSSREGGRAAGIDPRQRVLLG